MLSEAPNCHPYTVRQALSALYDLTTEDSGE
jgi:hypothetical protein